MLHGGWWQEGSIDDAGRVASALRDEGAIAVSIGYSLAPDRSLPEIVAEAAAAIRSIAETAPDFGGDPRRIVVGGHSAGAHLAACMVTDLVSAETRDAVAGLLLVSGAYDLEPVAESCVNDAVRMSEGDARTLSPALRSPLCDVPVHLHVGARESSEFLRQSRLLRERWSPALAEVRLEVHEDRDHFDILEGFDEPAGALHLGATTLLRRGVRT